MQKSHCLFHLKIKIEFILSNQLKMYKYLTLIFVIVVGLIQNTKAAYCNGKVI